MNVIQLERKNNTQTLLNQVEEEYKTALPFSKAYLEGQIYLLKQLDKNGVNIPFNMVGK